MPSGRTNRAASVLEHSPTAQLQLSDRRIEYANRAARELFEVSDTRAEDFLSLVDPVDRERVRSTLANCRRQTTCSFRTPDGRSIDSEWRRTDTGRLVGSLRAVTDRRERAATLERDAAILDSLLEHLPYSIYVKDRHSRHVRVSDAMLCSSPDSAITGPDGKEHHHAEDVCGKTDFDLYDPEFAAAAVAEDREVMATETPMVDELAESTTNLGETIVTRTTKAPRYDASGRVVGIVGVTQDVTERVMARRDLERQNERLEEFTEVLAHDLRNPLEVARGNLELLADSIDLDPGEAGRQTAIDREALAGLEEALDRMSDLIGEIRSFVIESRTVEETEPIALPALARRAWNGVDTAGATLQVRATRTIRADPDRLRRLFENLYRNAIEHARTDGSVRVVVDDHPEGFVVADDGPGVPAADRDRIFERGVSTGTDSTGFGLAIVETIAAAHGWSVAMTDADDEDVPADGAAVVVTDVVRTA